MLMQSSTEENSCTVGIRRARHLSGRHSAPKTLPREVRISTDVDDTLASRTVIVSHSKKPTDPYSYRAILLAREKSNSDHPFRKEFKGGFVVYLLLLLATTEQGGEIGLLVASLRISFSIGPPDVFAEIKLEIFDVLSGRVVGTVSGCAICSVFVPVAVSTVRALYAGTLVTCWTTAPCHRSCRSSSALLAVLCLILATLTITARCYAFSNATHPLVQLNPQPRSLINADSSTQTQHSSRIVLSRLFKSPRKIVQSDTRIIVTNSKILLYNQTFKIFNRTNFNAHSKTKRELQTTNPVFLNDFQSYQTKTTYSEENSSLYKIKEDTQSRSNAIPTYPLTTSENPSYSSDKLSKYSQTLPFFHSIRTAELKANHTSSDKQTDKDVEGTQLLNFDKRSDILVNGTNGSEGVWNTSANANFSEVSSTLQVVDHQNDEGDKRRPLPESRVPQPMPPAHGHNDNSCKCLVIYFYSEI